MTEAKWGALSPELVSQWINFDKDNTDWRYISEQSISMAAKQTEGVAYLWNILSLHGTALLADEVGMGKTFQALGVASLLWKMKPEAKILVMAPNRDICKHWVREYEEFIHSHYREMDHHVKNSADGGPVHKAKLCFNLSSLVDAIKSKKGSLFFTTIHALSGLVSPENKNGDLGKKASEAASVIHDQIKEVMGKDGFDLIIVDEAHYFRNAKGGSQRAHAAKAFFGSEGRRLGKKALLMTATPSHSGLSDIANVLNNFTDIGQVNETKDLIALLDKFTLRRLRLMKGKEENNFHNKHHYRREIAVEANFEKNPESELFFALYQKKLVKELGESKTGKKFLYGYLEGFESVGVKEELSPKENSNEKDSTEKASNEFKKAPDSKILEKLTKQYTKLFKTFPEHPKYSLLVNEVVPNKLFKGDRDLHDDKNLIFVRRIPSVRELTQRINLAYDLIMARKIITAWGLKWNSDEVGKWKKRSWSRAGFIELLEKVQITNNSDTHFESDLPDLPVDSDSSLLGSRIADLFVIKKGKGGATDCSNVSLRFRKPDNLFSLFMEPASDYKDGFYSGYYKNDDKNRQRNFYSTAAKDIRLSNFDGVTRATEGASSLSNTLTSYKNMMPSAWSLIYPYLESEHKIILEGFLQRDKGIVENFGNYIKNGFLFASPVMLEIYCWFTEFNLKDKTGDVQQKYMNFLAFVKPKLKMSLILVYFKSALETFEAICTKITDHKLHDWKKDWRVLASLNNPAWFASSETKNRQRLILGFNSPFYPNVLMATSVFQEGVNLHLQCHKVFHYGIAWTPGDNEQRVGRIDRLFGKVNNQLMTTGQSSLHINYPYLMNSFDEDQVGAFIKNKHAVEQKMDFCIPGHFDSVIDISEGNENWRDYLRTPIESQIVVNDPYPANFKAQYKPITTYQAKYLELDDIKDHLHGVLSSILDNEKETLFSVKDNNINPNALFLIDPIIENNQQLRHQPILIEKHFCTEFSSLVDGTVYYITLKTPIASKQTLGDDIKDKLKHAFEIYSKSQRQFPLVQLAINEDYSLSHFYCYMKVDLPVFVQGGKLSMLSSEEVSMAFDQLKGFADSLEIELFSLIPQDLRVEQLKIHNDAIKINKKISTLTSTRNTIKLNANWHVLTLETGKVVQLNHKFDLDDLRELVYIKNFNIIEQILKWNCKYPFLKFTQTNEELCVEINYPLVDFQEEEQNLLEKWFYYCCNQLFIR